MEVANINTLPLELKFDILLRLSLKQILRLKCVSKLWKGEISSLSFRELYQLRKGLDTSSSDDGSIVLVNEVSVISFDFHSNTLKELRPPPNLSGVHFMCSYNGLLLFAEPNQKSGLCALYNPLTSTYDLLPPFVIDVADHPGPDFNMINAPHMGFGYDSGSNDYKILRLFQYKKIMGSSWNERHEAAYIYSMKTNSWKIIKPYLPCGYMYDYNWVHPAIVYCNNALHWMSANYTDNMFDLIISALHLGTERYAMLPKPAGLADSRASNLVVLKGCLHLINETFSQNYDCWIMREYGVKHSWKKLFRYSYAELVAESGVRGYIRPLPYAYSADGQEILVGIELYPRTFICYNLRTRKMKKVIELADMRFETRFKAEYSVVPWVPTLAACNYGGIC